MELLAKNIRKSFGASNVLDGVEFHVQGGEICALIGENGAGKSTLMNIIGGIFPPDSGEIWIDGEEVSFSSPADSLRSGIAFIHQELNLINHLTVYENLFLSSFPTKGITLDKRGMIQRTAEVFDSLGVSIDPCAEVGSLDASYKQMVEIARALLSEASLIIMDEPTASLTAAEIGRIFQIMCTLREQGIALVFISHKLNEVMQICDRYAVLRNGTLVKSGAIADVTAKQLAALMVGHEIFQVSCIAPVAHGEEVLRIEHLSDGKYFHDVSLSVRQGEILGVTGLLGDGRSELFETVFGLRGGNYTGKIFLKGKEIHLISPHNALQFGFAFLPKNRKENAIIEDMNILDNGTAVTFSAYRKHLHMDHKAQEKAFSQKATELQIKMSDALERITVLSGGNQQKVVLAKWLLSDPKVLILDNPTQGVDVGAKEEIYRIIEELATEGIAIIVLSSEAQEIIRICHRSLVLYHGKVAGEVNGSEMDEQKIMVLATGAGKENANDE